MNDLDMYAMFGAARIDTKGYLPTHNVSLLSDVVEQTRTLVSEFNSHVAVINESKKFTPEGKAAELGSLAANYANRLAASDPVFAQARRDLAALQVATAIKPIDETPVTVMREIELRAARRLLCFPLPVWVLPLLRVPRV